MTNYGMEKRFGVLPQYRFSSFKSFTRKGKKFFYIDWWAWNGEEEKLKRKTKQCPGGLTERQAKQWAMPIMREVDQLLAQGFHYPKLIPDKLLFIEAIDKYIEVRLPVLTCKKDVAMTFRFLRSYALEHCPSKLLEDFKTPELKGFLDYYQRLRNWSNQTRKNKKYIISSMFEHWRDMGKIGENPARRLKNEKTDGIRHYNIFSKQQLQNIRILAMQKDPQLFVAINLIYYMFIRPDELRYIKIGHLMMEEQRLLLEAKNVKNKKEVRIYIPKNMRAILEESGFLNAPSGAYLFSKKGKPGEHKLGYHNLRVRFKKLLELQGLSKTHSLYSLKPTGVCSMYRQTKDLYAIKERGRFHSLEIVEIYLSRYNELYKENLDFD